jgi:hypothetical protein
VALSSLQAAVMALASALQAAVVARPGGASAKSGALRRLSQHGGALEAWPLEKEEQGRRGLEQLKADFRRLWAHGAELLAAGGR